MLRCYQASAWNFQAIFDAIPNREFGALYPGSTGVRRRAKVVMMEFDDKEPALRFHKGDQKCGNAKSVSA